MGLRHHALTLFTSAPRPPFLLVHMHSTKYYFSTVQNSSRRVEEWGGVDSLY
jgi:hypothetical protein